VPPGLVLVPVSVPPLPVEDCPLAGAHGRVLREPVRADRDLPPFDRATIGAALLEMQASGVAFNTALLRGYCRKLVDAANRSPVTILGEPSNRETRNRAVLFEGLDRPTPT
jgi:molybdopterin molybdotransferase